MVRGKVPIEDPAAMQVSFSKLHKELITKAKELSSMCDAQVGVIVFSAASKLIYFGNPGIDEIIERRDTHLDTIQALEKPPLDLNVEEEKCDEEELIVRQMEGEELENLSIMEQLNLIEEMLQKNLNRVKEQRQLNEKTIAEVQHTIHLVEEKDQKNKKGRRLNQFLLRMQIMRMVYIV
ncbi:MADS-box transcription factor 22 [Carex littledalei]|uniref:MADS-box transcription factor 22 n=1 Tax=Carex littledalei TaxID=544730 RepID=A0A833RNS3_9POAL|nr:MADS-box transcription factor 22 [Carex littledalei]